jgi:hypothetical protein
MNKIVHRFTDQFNLAAAASQTIFDSNQAADRHLPQDGLSLIVSLRGGQIAATGTDYPVELLLLEYPLAGEFGAHTRTWLFPGDGTCELVIPLTCAFKDATGGAAGRWVLSALNPAGGQTKNNLQVMASVVRGILPQRADYMLANKMTGAANTNVFGTFAYMTNHHSYVAPISTFRNNVTGVNCLMNIYCYAPTILGGPVLRGVQTVTQGAASASNANFSVPSPYMLHTYNFSGAGSGDFTAESFLRYLVL